MAWIKVECRVARHHKFQMAGSAASWLWICGLAYCQEGLTDGYIPSSALRYLGVRGAPALASALVRAGLWEATEGGWMVHDYLDHNRDAGSVRGVQEDRRLAGAQGGRASGAERRNKSAKEAKQNEAVCFDTPTELASTDAKQTANLVQLSTATASVQLSTATEPDAMDEWARELVKLYPAQGRVTWNVIEAPLFAVLTADPGVAPSEAWRNLKGRLDSQKRSHQWVVKGMIPRLDRYLRDGSHAQELPEHPVSTLVTDKTARTLSSAASFIKAGQRGA